MLKNSVLPEIQASWKFEHLHRISKRPDTGPGNIKPLIVHPASAAKMQAVLGRFIGPCLARGSAVPKLRYACGAEANHLSIGLVYSLLL